MSSAQAALRRPTRWQVRAVAAGVLSLGAAVTAAGCGERAPATGPSSVAWQPLGSLPAIAPDLTESGFNPLPPLAFELHRRDGSVETVEYAEKADAPGSLFVCPSPGAAWTPYVVPTGLARVRDLDLHERGDGRRLVVVLGDVETSPPRSGLRVYVDADGDARVTATDARPLLIDASAPPTGSRWLDVRATATGMLFVLDVRNHRVLRVTDGDGDGVAETLQPAPFVDSTDTAWLADVHSLSWDDELACLGLHREAEHVPDGPDEVLWVRDTDGDGRADAFSTRVTHPEDDAPPRFGRDPMAGDTTVPVAGPAGAHVDLWRVTGSPATEAWMLGTVTIDASTREATLSTTVPLEAGWTVRLRDATHQRVGLVEEVVAAAPRIDDVAPRSVVTSIGGTVVLTGRDFAVGTSVDLLHRGAATEGYGPTSVTVVSPTRIEVTFPPATPAVRGDVVVRLRVGEVTVARTLLHLTPGP